MTNNKDPAFVRFLRWLRATGAPRLRTPLLWIAVLASVAGVVLLSTPVFHINAYPVWAWSLLALAAVAVAVRFLLATPVLRQIGSWFPKWVTAPSRRERYSEPIDPTELSKRYMEAFAQSEFVDSIQLTLRALVSPGTTVLRISEHHTIGRERSEISLSRTIAREKNLTLVPVHTPAKGRTVGNLRVEVNEKRSRTLRYDEAKGLLLIQLAGLFRRVAGRSRQDLLSEISNRIIDRTETLPADVARIVTDLRGMRRNAGATEKDVESLISFVRIALVNDVIFAVIPDDSPNGTRVTIRYSSPHEGVSGLSSRLRRAVGIQEPKYSVNVRAAADSPSYHLQIDGPANLYVDARSMNMAVFGKPDQEPENAANRGHARDVWMDSGPLAGDESLHLYMRDFDGRPLVGDVGVRKYNAMPYFQTVFLETPPGILGPTAAVALWLMALTWIVGSFHHLVFPGGNLSAGSWPTLIFGIPAIVTGWLLSKANADAMRVSSVSSFILLIWLALNAAVVVTLAALKSTGIRSPQWLAQLGIPHPAWSLVMVLTALNAAACVALFLIRTFRYASRTNERRYG